jgi:exosortase A-associated hydrolase 2
MSGPAAPPAQPFFLNSGAAARFCLFHPPRGDCRGGLVYVHPFAEEMNKSRRAAANAARVLAAQGIGVLQIDLHGCGDSAGDFADARWDDWRADVTAAAAWLEQRLGGKVGLFGLRLGALLALDCAAAVGPTRLLLWQPVLDGKAFLTQFLRLRLARDMLDDSGAGGGTAALRAQLAAGTSVEIAGYELAPPLALALDQLHAAQLVPPCPVDWLEVVAAPERPLPPAAARVVAGWRAHAVEVRTATVPAAQFWNAQEIDECPALVAATGALLDRVAA